MQNQVHFIGKNNNFNQMICITLPFQKICFIFTSFSPCLFIHWWIQESRWTWPTSRLLSGRQMGGGGGERGNLTKPARASTRLVEYWLQPLFLPQSFHFPYIRGSLLIEYVNLCKMQLYYGKLRKMTIDWTKGTIELQNLVSWLTEGDIFGHHLKGLDCCPFVQIRKCHYIWLEKARGATRLEHLKSKKYRLFIL